jgi:hypothetical protein
MPGHSHMGIAKTFYSDNPLLSSVCKAIHYYGCENGVVFVVEMSANMNF